MSNAKVRARRRRRANHAWTKATEHVIYSVTEWRHVRAHDNLWLQCDAAALGQAELEKLLRERFPGALFIHDELISEVPVADLTVMKKRVLAALDDWHKTGATFDHAETLRVSSDRPNVRTLP